MPNILGCLALPATILIFEPKFLVQKVTNKTKTSPKYHQPTTVLSLPLFAFSVAPLAPQLKFTRTICMKAILLNCDIVMTTIHMNSSMSNYTQSVKQSKQIPIPKHIPAMSTYTTLKPSPQKSPGSNTPTHVYYPEIAYISIENLMNPIYGIYINLTKIILADDSNLHDSVTTISYLKERILDNIHSNNFNTSDMTKIALLTDRSTLTAPFDNSKTSKPLHTISNLERMMQYISIVIDMNITPIDVHNFNLFVGITSFPKPTTQLTITSTTTTTTATPLTSSLPF
eukprot:jgi/Psemu1/8949/gm1.8949_g